MRSSVIRALEGTAADFEGWSVRFSLALFYGLPPTAILLSLLVAGRAVGVTEDGSLSLVATFAGAAVGACCVVVLVCLGAAGVLRMLSRSL